MSMEVYTLDQSSQWDAIVYSFIDYDVYWLSGYVKAFKIHGDGEPLLLYYNAGNTRGINVIMKRDVSEDERFTGFIGADEYYDITTVYGYGGWIIEGDKKDDLFKSYRLWMLQNGIICEFVRFHPMIRNHLYADAYYNVIEMGEVVHMELSSPEVIWSNITSKNRNMIRKALKNGVRIFNGRFPEIFENFRMLYNRTMDKDNAEEYYYFEKEFYDSILEDLSNNAQVFYAEKDGIIIAAAIILTSNKKMSYHLSGSLCDYNSLAPTNLLLYRAALWGYSNGYKTFYLGGGVGSGEDSLFRFKRAFFKGELNHFYIGKTIYDQEKYDELVRIRQVIDNPGYFPMYRG